MSYLGGTTVLGVKVVTRCLLYRNDHSHFQSPHANELGQLIANNILTGKKPEIRSQIDLTKELYHGENLEVTWSARER